MAVSFWCVRRRIKGSKVAAVQSRSTHQSSSTSPRSPSRRQSAPAFRNVFPGAPAGLVPDRPGRDSLPALEAEKTMELNFAEDSFPEKYGIPEAEEFEEEASAIDPGFMRELSTIMEASTERSFSHRSQALSFSESAYSRQSNPLSGSTKSDSTIILPAPFPNHSRHVSDTGSMFGPSRVNSAVGPWRDSIWSTTATPTAVYPPSSAYASQRQSRRSQSLSAHVARVRDANSWAEDPSPHSSRRPPGSALLPPLPTPDLGKATSNQSRHQASHNDPSSWGTDSIMCDSWPLN